MASLWRGANVLRRRQRGLKWARHRQIAVHQQVLNSTSQANAGSCTIIHQIFACSQPLCGQQRCITCGTRFSQCFDLQVCRAIDSRHRDSANGSRLGLNVTASISSPTSLVQPHIFGMLCHAETNGIVSFLHDPGRVFTELVHARSSIEYLINIGMTPQEKKRCNILRQYDLRERSKLFQPSDQFSTVLLGSNQDIQEGFRRIIVEPHEPLFELL